jgi:hypothetical protein
MLCSVTPNTLVETEILLNFITKITNWNEDRYAGCTDWGTFWLFLSAVGKKPGIVSRKNQNSLSHLSNFISH